jgi:hypothetical protein
VPQSARVLRCQSDLIEESTAHASATALTVSHWGDVAIVVVNNPPVNTLSRNVRQKLLGPRLRTEVSFPISGRYTSAAARCESRRWGHGSLYDMVGELIAKPLGLRSFRPPSSVRFASCGTRLLITVFQVGARRYRCRTRPYDFNVSHLDQPRHERIDLQG